jgi:hypothetical protein
LTLSGIDPPMLSKTDPPDGVLSEFDPFDNRDSRA